MNLFASLMRTIVPVIAGAILTALVHIGVTFDSATVASIVTAVLTGAYYTAFRLLEHLATSIQSPALARIAGFLLGWATPPDYPGTARPAVHPAPPTAPSGV